ncbi:hypothetical protein AB5I41_25665 [Sphingomonas sp. MMS24-JH45]
MQDGACEPRPATPVQPRLPTFLAMYAVPRQQRIGSAVAAGVVTAGIGWALLTGLAGGVVREKLGETLALFRVPPPPPVKVVPKKVASARPSGRAAPPNIRSQATPVVAPPPIVVVPLPAARHRRTEAVRGRAGDAGRGAHRGAGHRGRQPATAPARGAGRRRRRRGGRHAAALAARTTERRRLSPRGGGGRLRGHGHGALPRLDRRPRARLPDRPVERQPPARQPPAA